MRIRVLHTELLSTNLMLMHETHAIRLLAKFLAWNI